LNHGNLVFKDFNKAPALCATERASFHNAYSIPDLGFVFLVVGMEFGDMFGNFTELGVWHAGDCANNDSFIHLIRDDFANANFAKSAGLDLCDYRSDCFFH